MVRSIINWISCNILGIHEWTCNAKEGIPATEKQIRGGIMGFADYAKMYCKYCRKESKLNRRLKAKQ
jgi:hypothetical protein